MPFRCLRVVTPGVPLSEERFFILSLLFRLLFSVNISWPWPPSFVNISRDRPSYYIASSSFGVLRLGPGTIVRGKLICDIICLYSNKSETFSTYGILAIYTILSNILKYFTLRIALSCMHLCCKPFFVCKFIATVFTYMPSLGTGMISLSTLLEKPIFFENIKHYKSIQPYIRLFYFRFLHPSSPACRCFSPFLFARAFCPCAGEWG